jgi:lipoprotein-anchoring transpeptidase ErfK/SrfK
LIRVVPTVFVAGVLMATGCGGPDVDHPAGTETSVRAPAGAINRADSSSPTVPSTSIADTALPSSSTPAVDPDLTTVAQATGSEVAVYERPAASANVLHRLASPTATGAPLVFVVVQAEGDWLRVLLPVRPNGSEGWINARDVALSDHQYRIVISLQALRITVYSGDDVVLDEPVGVGTVDAPTPGGRYYIKELLQPPDPGGPYGPYAYGLSGFSNELTSFAGGEGVIGIHGTNDPSSIGRQSSHGCIRMSNDGITYLSRILPLGVPVEIVE